MPAVVDAACVGAAVETGCWACIQSAALLRLAGGGEDGAWTIFDGFEPRGNVGGVLDARAVGNAEIGQDETRRR